MRGHRYAPGMTDLGRMYFDATDSLTLDLLGEILLTRRKIFHRKPKMSAEDIRRLGYNPDEYVGKKAPAKEEYRRIAWMRLVGHIAVLTEKVKQLEKERSK